MFIETVEVILDAIKDTLIVFPFLLGAFILVAVIENHVKAEKLTRVLGGRMAPLIGSATGAVPVCGFSTMAAKLFQEGCITFGTLVAMFIAASDEGVIVLLTGGRWKEFLLVTGLKIAIAVAVGYAVNFLTKSGEASHGDGDVNVEFGHCHHGGEGGSAFYRYFVHPLLHCLKTLAFVFGINLVLGLVIYFVGEENFKNFMASTGYFQPFVAALIGLIPNCAPSVVISETFVAGNLSFGGLLAGLIANAGVGLTLIFRSKEKLRRNLSVLLILYFVGVMAGEAAVLVSLL